MDGDWSYLVDCISWNHKGILSWSTGRSLTRSGTIGQDEVETSTFTIFVIVFKASECIKSTIFLQHLLDHCCTWELKHWPMAVSACRLWKPVISFAVDFLHPLGYSSVKESVDPLQLYPLPVFEAKLGDEDKAMWLSNLTAKLLWSRGLEICPNVVRDLLLCSSIQTERGRYVHFYC